MPAPEQPAVLLPKRSVRWLARVFTPKKL